MPNLPSGLIGYTGFVGGHLARQREFDEYYNSKNIADIKGRQFDCLVVSAMPAAMWIANQHPDDDRAALDRLLGSLLHVQAEKVVVVSTVCVYPLPVGVNESSLIDDLAQSPYGRHRQMLECELRENYPDVLCVRLPGLFGNGLKKNAIFDLLHDNQVEKLNPDSIYQFYDLEWLWRDISVAMTAGLGLVNLTTEPTSLREVAEVVFGYNLRRDERAAPAARFDVRSIHAAVFGGQDGYAYNREQVLFALKSFVAGARMEAKLEYVE